MKKNELVHFHALLARLAEDLSGDGVLDQDSLEEYEAVGVTPMTLRAPRDRHEEAVLVLAETLATAVEGREGSVRDAPTPS